MMKVVWRGDQRLLIGVCRVGGHASSDFRRHISTQYYMSFHLIATRFWTTTMTTTTQLVAAEKYSTVVLVVNTAYLLWPYQDSPLRATEESRYHRLSSCVRLLILTYFSHPCQFCQPSKSLKKFGTTPTRKLSWKIRNGISACTIWKFWKFLDFLN